MIEIGSSLDSIEEMAEEVPESLVGARLRLSRIREALSHGLWDLFSSVPRDGEAALSGNFSVSFLKFSISRHRHPSVNRLSVQ